MSSRRGTQIEQDLPALVQAAGWDSIGRLREKSCLSDPSPQNAPRETQWVGSAARGVSTAEAADIAERVGQAAEKMGWSPADGAGAHGDRLYGAQKDSLTLAVRHLVEGGDRTLSVEIHSPCQAMPEGHTMSRSEYDPMYGSNDPLYPNDDRSKFNNGKPKPFPQTDD